MSPESLEDHSDPEALPPGQRWTVTNGRRIFVEGNGNSAWERRYRDLLACHIAVLGGRNVLSEGQVSLAERASVSP